MITERTYSWRRSLARREGPPRGVVIHHAAAAVSPAATIHRWHLDRGWAGIGYHYVVRRSGMIERGRPEWAMGGHARGHNDRLGICCEGNLQTQYLTGAQYDSLLWLTRDIRTRHGSIPVTRHSDHGSTACPGRNFPWAVFVSDVGKVASMDDRRFKWVTAYLPASKMGQVRSHAVMHGLKLLEMAGLDSGRLCLLHAEDSKADAFMTWANVNGGQGVHWYRATPDSTIRRTNAPTTVTL